jgi:hypothetical protein
MFSSGMVETKSNTVEIKDMDINVMKKLIDLYSRQVCSSCSSSGTCHVIVQQNLKNIK